MLDYYTLLITLTPLQPSLLFLLSTMISQITINQPSVPPPSCYVVCVSVQRKFFMSNPSSVTRPHFYTLRGYIFCQKGKSLLNVVLIFMWTIQVDRESKGVSQSIILKILWPTPLLKLNLRPRGFWVFESLNSTVVFVRHSSILRVRERNRFNSFNHLFLPPIQDQQKLTLAQLVVS